MPEVAGMRHPTLCSKRRQPARVCSFSWFSFVRRLARLSGGVGCRRPASITVPAEGATPVLAFVVQVLSTAAPRATSFRRSAQVPRVNGSLCITERVSGFVVQRAGSVAGWTCDKAAGARKFVVEAGRFAACRARTQLCARIRPKRAQLFVCHRVSPALTVCSAVVFFPPACFKYRYTLARPMPSLRATSRALRPLNRANTVRAVSSASCCGVRAAT